MEECFEAFREYTKYSDCFLVIGPYNSAKIKELVEKNQIENKQYTTTGFLKAMKKLEEIGNHQKNDEEEKE